MTRKPSQPPQGRRPAAKTMEVDPTWLEPEARKGPPPLPAPAPVRLHTVTTRIVTRDVAGLVAFLKSTFAATGDVSPDGPAIMSIGDSHLMISAAGPRPEMGAFLYVYVEDADVTYRRALRAGAASLEAPLDTPYGDRRGMVQDRWGNIWQIATPRRR